MSSRGTTASILTSRELSCERPMRWPPRGAAVQRLISVTNDSALVHAWSFGSHMRLL